MSGTRRRGGRVLDNPPPEMERCYNCKSMLWMIGIGQGLQCKHPENRTPDGRMFHIPSRQHVCPLFERIPARGKVAQTAEEESR